MDEILLKQLVRQIKILNAWVTIFGSLVLVGFLIMLFLIFKVVTYVHDTTQKLSNLQSQAQNSLNLKSQVCSNSSLANLLGSSTCSK